MAFGGIIGQLGKTICQEYTCKLQFSFVRSNQRTNAQFIRSPPTHKVRTHASRNRPCTNARELRTAVASYFTRYTQVQHLYSFGSALNFARQKSSKQKFCLSGLDCPEVLWSKGYFPRRARPQRSALNRRALVEEYEKRMSDVAAEASQIIEHQVAGSNSNQNVFHTQYSTKSHHILYLFIPFVPQPSLYPSSFTIPTPNPISNAIPAHQASLSFHL